MDDLLARAAYKSRADVDLLVASIQARPAPKVGVRKLPERRSDALITPPPAACSPDASAPGTVLPTAAPAEPSPAAADAPASPLDLAAAPSAPASRPHRSVLRPVSGSEWSLRVTLDDACKADLEILRDLLSHKIPDGDLASVLHEAIRCAIDKHGKRRGAVPPSRTRKPGAKPAPAPADTTETRTPRPLANATSESDLPALFPVATPSPRSRPSAAARREVFARDGGSCAWLGEDGRRCGSTWQLELDHVRAAALGGGATVEELRLLCKAHNMLHAEQVFGRERMEPFRRPRFAGAGPRLDPGG